jgi:crotonobetainyl-CoA:carnitine CoA-transferase CaiB-like acyl-CoA transferase
VLDSKPSEALRGIRILDLTIISAGAGATMLLADMGAEVIKVESTRYIDPFRNSLIHPKDEPGEHPWNRAAPFNTMNRNKYGITLDLTQPRGRELFLLLAKQSDVVANNFRVGVMKNFCLDYEVLREVNPNLVVIDISSQGAFGPESRYGSYGSTLDALSGLAFITGYEGGPPVWSGQTINYPDQLACTLAAGAILAGLYYRMETGTGCYIDLSQRESITSLLGEVVLDASLNNREPVRMGNGHAYMVPHGCYPCAGEDQWVTIAVDSDEKWPDFCKAIGREDLLTDRRFADYRARYYHRADLDGIVAEWTVLLEPYEVLRRLSTVGIATGPVVGGREALEDPQLKARHYFQEVEQPEAGTFPIKTRPMKLSKTDGTIHMPAPSLGQHNDYVLGHLLGLTPQAIAELEQANVIGTVPMARRS